MTANKLTIVVDAMGGDDAPGSIVAGARLAVERDGQQVILVGDPDRMGDTGDLEVIPASQVIEMGAEPASAVRRLKDSSIIRAAEAVRDGRGAALLSAGNTGAAMAASLLRMGRIRGVARPAIAVPYPVPGSTPTIVLDCGANAECSADWLVQFAVLGIVYSRARYGVSRPRVGVLTIGEEEGKGNKLVKEVCALFDAYNWDAVDAQHVGNIEGRDLLHGTADVVVTDGFTGNVVLKSLEGAFAVFEQSVNEAFAASSALKEQSSTIASTVQPVYDRFDPTLAGAAVLLGVRGTSLISHGSSSPATIAHAIGTAESIASLDLIGKIRDTFRET